jgi:hypothetical protein
MLKEGIDAIMHRECVIRSRSWFGVDGQLFKFLYQIWRDNNLVASNIFLGANRSGISKNKLFDLT